MAYSVPTANNFCPLPFTGIFYQNNSASPCCAMKTKPASPNEYRASKETRKLQQDFIEGLKSDRCNNCWVKESNGSKSIRNYFTEPRDLTKITHMELRESNLCNFSCRMCNASDSVVIEREVKRFPELQSFFESNNDVATSDENWKQIFELAKDVESINLTGGEPMLMKRYYDFLDHLVAIGNKNVKINIYTNGSVFNNIFSEKLLNFPNATLYFSIDAVGKVAEYQRHGGTWNTIRQNIISYSQLPIRMRLHSTITAYSILDVSNLADYFIELKNMKCYATLLPFTAHIARSPKALELVNLNLDLRLKAIQSIDSAIEKLSNADYDFFSVYVKELVTAKNQLMTRKECDFKLFSDMTKALDTSRNESFEAVFGYKLA